MPKIVRLHQTGDASVLKIEEESARKPGAGEVLLKLEAFGLNRAEVLYRQGQYLEQTQVPSRIGYEGAGVVEAVGEGVDAGWIGKRVGTVPGFSMNQYGLWADQAVVPVQVLAVTPRNLPVEASAAIWMQYLTAYGGLLLAGELKRGDTAIITAASSSVGLAAIQIVKDQGGVSIATTRTSAKKEELLSLGADHVVATEEEDLPARVKAITGGKGADVIFDPVAGGFVEALAKCAGMNGRIVEYGALSLEPTPFPFRAALHKQLTMRGYTLHQVSSDPELRKTAIDYVTEKIEAGIFVPKIAKVFHGLAQIGAAQDYMETNAQVGKIVVVL
jgi:NADPH:quinone reductase-like Zn-dependent oxidoreductase